MKKYVNNSFINKSPLEYKNGTAAVTNLPVTIYTDGQPVSSYTLKGNTSVSGTPSPQNPVTISGVGNETANLINNSNIEQGGWDATAGRTPYKNINSKRCRYSDFFSISTTIVYYDFKDLNVNIIMVDSNGISLGGSGFKTGTGSFELLDNTDKISLIIANTDTTQNITPEYVQSKNISLDYGFKISILKDLQPLTPIYVSQPLMRINDSSDNILSTGTATRVIGKYEFTGQEYWLDNNVPIDNTYLYQVTITDMINVGNIVALDIVCTHFECGNYYGAGSEGVQHSFNRLYFRTAETTLENWKTWLANQYANGTPVTIYYILATPTTETVTAPTITTTGGEVSIDVDTTVKPSEIDLTYHGWHEHQPLKRENGAWT